MIRQLAVVIAAVSTFAPLAHAQQPPTTASLGTCKLSGGAVVPDCKVAYRAFGKLDQAKSNAVLIPTWLQGRSEEWIDLLGPLGLVDTTRYYVIVVDALGNGRSASPSTVAPSSRAAFRSLTIGDMVQSQHRLLTEALKIPHLRAVVGISMGGMQAFEWAVRYPSFVDLAVPIVGSARVGAFDHALWTMELQEIEIGVAAKVPADSIWAQLARMEVLFAQTPGAVNKLSWDSVLAEASAIGKRLTGTWSLEDYAAQLRAIRRHDVSASLGGDMKRAAQAVRAKLLVIYSPDDHMVTSGSAAEFASMTHAKTLAVPSPCGHLVASCEKQRFGAAIREFLSQ